MIQHFFQRIVESQTFKILSISCVALAGIVVGIETSQKMMKEYGEILATIDRLILAVFTLEIVIRIGVFGPRPWQYFRDPWNLFDFTVVALCLLPMGVNYVSVLRLVRTLRILRLLTILPRLQMIVGALLKSIPSIAYVGLLLCLHFYIYAVIGVFVFGSNDPVHFETLGKSMLTLFQVLTLEGWADIMRTQIYGCAEFGYDNFREACTASREAPVAASIFFVSFIIIGTMVILNLFIGVIMNGMQELAKENEIAAIKTSTFREKIAMLDAAMKELAELRRSMQEDGQTSQDCVQTNETGRLP